MPLGEFLHEQAPGGNFSRRGSKLAKDAHQLFCLLGRGAPVREHKDVGFDRPFRTVTKVEGGGMGGACVGGSGWRITRCEKGLERWRVIGEQRAGAMHCIQLQCILRKSSMSERLQKPIECEVAPPNLGKYATCQHAQFRHLGKISPQASNKLCFGQIKCPILPLANNV